MVRGGYAISYATFEELGTTPTQNAYPFENAVSAGCPDPRLVDHAEHLQLPGRTDRDYASRFLA